MAPARRLRSARNALPVAPAWLSLPAGLLAAGGALRYAPVSDGAAAMLAVTLFCVALWIGTPVPPWFTGLGCLGLVGVAFSTDLTLVGFRSPATWLVVLGILLGEATRRSGLAALVERRALSAVPRSAAGDAVATHRYLLAALSAVALAFAVLVPSSLVGVLVLGPILVSVGERFEERRARIGLFLGPLFVTYYGATGILTESLANIIIAGLVEANAGLSIGWVEWLAWLGPVMAVGRSLAVVAVAYILYRPKDRDAVAPTRTADGGDSTESGPADDRHGSDGDHGPAAASGSNARCGDGKPAFASLGPERRMLLFLLAGVAVWATDAVHGLHPLYGALIVVLLAFAPRIGVADGSALTDADFSIVFFLGAIFAIAGGLRRTGFTDLAATGALSYLPADAPLPVVLGFVAAVAVALTFLMEGLAVASVLTPVLVSFSEGAGVPLLSVAMTEAVALNAYFFPYQSAVLVAVLGLDVVDPPELIRMAAICSLVTLAVLLPLQVAVFALAF